jgi:MSHA pilin protein MshA
MKKNQGFTLVELVIVIVILGILAITAAPKFLNLAGDAKGGTLNAVKASLQSANAVVYSKAVLAGNQKAATGTVNESGSTLNVVYGYVDATATDVGAVLDLDGNFVVATAVANSALGMTTADVMIYPTGTTAPTASTTAVQGCVLVYKEATASAKPTYTATIAGC